MKKIILSLLAVCMLGACATDPYTGESKVSKTAWGTGIGAAVGAGVGALVGGEKGALIGAGIGGATGAATGGYMDIQASKLRQQLAGTGVQVLRDGDNVRLIMPNSITFNTNEAVIKTSANAVLDSVALVAKEYDKTNGTIFEGEFLNGIKNGKAKIYYVNDRTTFEGEYLNGIINGKAKIYYENGNQEFIGLFKNGLKHGQCKEFSEFGKLVFDGEYNEGIKWNGKERILYNCDKRKIVIERKYKDGKALCVEYYEHKKFDPKYFDIKGLEFIQELINKGHDKKDFSEDINYESYITNLLFIGEHIDDKSIKDRINRNGKGMEYHENKSTFEGEYKDGKRINGKGKIYNNKGNLIFDGDYINGKRNGKGIEYYEDIEENEENINIESNLLIKYEGKYIDDPDDHDGHDSPVGQ